MDALGLDAAVKAVTEQLVPAIADELDAGIARAANEFAGETHELLDRLNGTTITVTLNIPARKENQGKD